MSQKDERAASIIHHSVGSFLIKIQEPGVLVTVTHVEVKDMERSVLIYVSIFPTAKENETLKKLKRERSNLREHVREHERLMNIPLFDFTIDRGEKNRQQIEEISGKIA